MKKLTILLLLCGSMLAVNAQWSTTTIKRNSTKEISTAGNGYKLDLVQLRNQLKNAQEMGKNSKSVEISIPTLSGKIERFAVHSFPVMVKELADQYQLGSYVGVGIDDPGKYLRFSVSPSDFQGTIINNGSYEFIDPVIGDKSTYLVHPKTVNSESKNFLCSTTEDPASVKQMNDLLKSGRNFKNQPGDFSKSSDKKYRTMRLALSVTGEYTQFHGGTVAGALSAMNATMTRVNGVFEKDLALHLDIQNFPGIIYTNAATDPYTGNLNSQLQANLTANVGNVNYDIGHVFNAAGGNGNAGCIGCVCINPTAGTPNGKGSAFTQSTSPQGDTFDIDYVAHEMGHQLGGNHTFSHSLEGAGTNMEPGSGSTIMGYAGITGVNTDVQLNSDPYFHVVSIFQIQSNLISKTCDVEIPTVNNPPLITALPPYTIPKGTAFVLTAVATDPEGNPLTYNWEQTDNATVTINKNNLGNTTSGASFRSVVPNVSPTRYFPKLSSVLNGVLDNSTNQWESVSKVARNSYFAVTVRDNNPNPLEQQTQFDEQNITVGNDGPFTVNTQFADIGAPSNVQWTVANTAAAPYNVANVKIDYTTNAGATWNVLLASTPNDGAELVSFPASLNGQSIKLRVSSIGNVFYAVKTVAVSAFAACTGTPPTALAATNITVSSADLSWQPIAGATYTVRYRKVGTVIWTTVNSNDPILALTGLMDGTNYEYQVLAICSGTPTAYSASFTFTTGAITYCSAGGASATTYFINNVSIATVVNPSGSATYSNFTTNPALQINLVKGIPNIITITGNSVAANFANVYMDYNRDGVFDASERVLNFPVTNTATFSGTIIVPNSAVITLPIRMRVMYGFAGTANLGLVAPASWVCGNTFYNGEVEDYNVVVSNNLATTEIINPKDGIQIYPNPATDILNISRVSKKAIFEIYSIAGQLLIKGSIINGKVNVSKLSIGNYILKVTDNEVDQSFKFIKR